MQLCWFTSIDSKSTSSKAALEGVFVSSGFKRITVHVTLSFAGLDGNQYVAQQDAKAQAAVGKLEILDANNKDAVIDKKVTTVVGKKVSLKGRIVPAPDPKDVAEPLWTIAPTTVKSYKTDEKAGVKTDLAKADLEKAAITYYWIDGGTAKVEFQTKYKGAVVKTKAVFDVERPTAEMSSKTTGDAPKTKGVAISSDYGFVPGLFLHFGKKTDPGIIWTGKVTASAGSGGEIAFVNLINALHKVTQDDKDSTKLTLSSGGEFVLDVVFPYDKAKKVDAKKTETIDSNDSPADPLADTDKFASGDNQFETYLMFRPDGADSIWVTIRVTTWYHKGSATKVKKGEWAFDKNPVPDASKNPESKESTALPVWTNNLKNLTFK